MDYYSKTVGANSSWTFSITPPVGVSIYSAVAVVTNITTDIRLIVSDNIEVKLNNSGNKSSCGTYIWMFTS